MHQSGFAPLLNVYIILDVWALLSPPIALAAPSGC